MHSVFCFLLLLSVGWLSAAKEVPFIQCDDTLFVPEKIIFVPYPPKPKADLSIFVTGVLSSNVTGGALAASFYPLGKDEKPWTSDFVDICSAFPCPLEAGFRDFEIRGVLRDDLPKGQYIARFVAVDDYARPLACVVFLVEVDAHAKSSTKDAQHEMSAMNFFVQT